MALLLAQACGPWVQSIDMLITDSWEADPVWLLDGAPPPHTINGHRPR